MIKIISSSAFYNRFTGLGGAGVRYLNGNTLSRMLRITNFYIAWNLTQARFQFDSGTRTITLLNAQDPRTFLTQEFNIGDIITVVGTASNDGDYTISDISEDGKTITVVEAIITETAELADIHGVTPVTAIAYNHNIVPNDSPETFVSMVDTGSLQRFYASGLDASSLSPVNMRVDTKSFAWVANEITDATTGETSEVTIRGSGITDYRQYFTVNHFFYVTPFYTAADFRNFSNNTPPLYYDQSSSVKYICRVDGFFSQGAAVADHTGAEISTKGTGGWYDRANKGGRPNYSLSDVTYQEVGTPTLIDALDVSKEIKVTMTLNSREGLFVAGVTELTLSFFVNPDADFTDTETTMLQNLHHDEVFRVVDSISADGINFGTDYQVIKAALFTFVDANTITVEFTFAPGSALVDYWQGKDDGQRYYTICVETQNSALTSTRTSDAVTCRAPFLSATWDKTDTTLLEFPGTGIEAFEFPSVGSAPAGSIEGFEGDPWFTQTAFQVKKTPNAASATPTVTAITFQVLASKTDQEDFVFEQTVLDTSRMKKMEGVQQLDADQERGFITYTGDPANAITISRAEAYDTVDYAGYTASYGLILRFEDWISALDLFQFLGASGLEQPGIASDFKDITMRWADFQSSGWSLFFRIIWNISDANGNAITPFASQIPVVMIATSEDGVISWPGSAGTAPTPIQYFTEDETQEINCIDREAPTLVRATYAGDFPLPVNAVGYYGRMFVLPKGNTMFSARWGSSAIPSEDGSPWSPTAADPLADESISNGNLRINIYIGVKIVIEGYFDSSIYDNTITDLNVYSRIGAIYSTSS
jgi:hypothetical protein